MTAIAIAMLALGFMLAGSLIGILIRRALPEDHLSSESKDVLKLSMGVVATLAALCLGC
jgi:NhaP-type Na+/H+ or K+/H+ antiporter